MALNMIYLQIINQQKNQIMKKNYYVIRCANFNVCAFFTETELLKKSIII